MTLKAPTPQVKSARQFLQADGSEFFLAEAHGRRPDVPDALRTMGTGATRVQAQRDALVTWQSAWRSLHPALQVADK